MPGPIVESLHYDYWPFGEEITTQGQDDLTHKYTGHERDFESNLDYMHARHYAFSLGRFMSPDPINGYTAAPQTFNLYSYVSNNPLNRIDPYGLMAVSEGSGSVEQPLCVCTVEPCNCGFGETVPVDGPSAAQIALAAVNDAAFFNFYLDYLGFKYWAMQGVHYGQRFGLFSNEWQRKFGAGYYWGTGFGEGALDYYGDVLADPESSAMEDLGAIAGGVPAALWTESTYLPTFTTFLTGASVAGWASKTGPWLGSVQLHAAHAGGPHQYPHLQLLVRGTQGLRLRVPQWFLKIFPSK